MPYLPAPIGAVRTGLRDFLRARTRAGELNEGDLVLVACSGGADSVALASQLAFWAPRMGLRAGLITVDHGMQAGSAAHARSVVVLGENLGLTPVLVRTFAPAALSPTSTGAGGPEGLARDMRYAAFEEALADTGARAILLAHTQQDQAETVLLALARGSGTRSLSGMAPQRGPYWRPLLGVRRADTVACCAELGLPVWEDPTNAPDGPWRTAAGDALPRAAIRHAVLPELTRALGQDPVPALARTADLARADADLLEELADAHWLRLTPAGTTPEGAPTGQPWDAATADLAEIPDALRWRILRRAITRAGADPGALSAHHIDRVNDLLVNWRGQGEVHLPGGVRARREYGRLVVNPPPLTLLERGT